MLRPFVHINARHSLVSPAIAICRRCVEYDCQLTSDADVQITPLINIAKAIYDHILEKLYLFSVPRVLRLFRYSLHSLKTYTILILKLSVNQKKNCRFKQDNR